MPKHKREPMVMRVERLSRAAGKVLPSAAALRAREAAKAQAREAQALSNGRAVLAALGKLKQ